MANKNYWIDAFFSYNRDTLNKTTNSEKIKVPLPDNSVQSVKDIEPTPSKYASLSDINFSAPAPADTNGQWRDPNAFINPNDTTSSAGLVGYASRYDSLLHDPWLWILLPD